MKYSSKARINRQDKWASDDDAHDLLAGILDETRTAAQAEQERIEAALRARKEEERRQQQLEEGRKRREAAALLDAEQSRQQQLEERRTARMEALRVEDLKARGEWFERPASPASPASPADRSDEVIAMQNQMETLRAQLQDMQRTRRDVTEASSTSRSPWMALVAIFTLVVGAGAVLGARAAPLSYEPDAASYTKVAFTPKPARELVTVVGFTPLPEEEPAAIEAPAKTKRPRRVRRPTRPAKPAKPTKPARPRFDLDLDDDDIFGEFDVSKKK